MGRMKETLYSCCVAEITRSMPFRVPTRTLNVRIPEVQYQMLESLVGHGQYTSISEFIRQMLRRELDDYAAFLHNRKHRDCSYPHDLPGETPEPVTVFNPDGDSP